MDVYVQASSGSVQGSSSFLSIPKVVPEPARRSANYHPTIWGEHFLRYASDNMNIDAHAEENLKQLKEAVRNMLVAAADNSQQLLNLIDDIQRLGVSYNFETEIDHALQHVFDANSSSHQRNEEDLYTVALRFRLLRQQGHNVSCDVFSKFKDSEGKLMESLKGDARGMLSLYEATHLRMHGEDILDEALAFTTTYLRSMITNFSNPLAAQVAHALKQPIHKGLTRLEARHYISIYQDHDSHNKVLLNFAKLDFNLLQKMHQRELSEITRWWRDLNSAEKFPFARDRIVECYFWILGVYFEPQYFLARKFLTKAISLTSIIDDIYDVYGTLEELILFTDAIERWDISALDQLPEYMGHCYRALLEAYDEIEEELAKEGRSYRVHYAKAAMKRLARAYFEEAKWFNEGYVPPVEEYMKVAIVSCGYMMLATASFVGMGELVTKEAFEWVSNDPLIVRASSAICRLMDDIVGHEEEQKRGHVASGIECYMKQHGVSEQEAVAEFQRLVVNAWKDMNQECLSPTTIPMPLLMRVVNLGRVINLLYQDEDGYKKSNSNTKNLVASLLIDSVL